jgi:hypothetical protein
MPTGSFEQRFPPGAILLQEVNLDDAYTGRLRLPSHLRRILSGLESDDKSGLKIVGRLQASCLQFCLLAATVGPDFPIVIFHDDPAVLVPQLKGRVRQGVVDAKSC